MIFQDLLKSAQFTKTTAILPIILGTDVFWGLVIKDLYTFPHMLIGGHQSIKKTKFKTANFPVNSLYLRI